MCVLTQHTPSLSQNWAAYNLGPVLSFISLICREPGDKFISHVKDFLLLRMALRILLRFIYLLPWVTADTMDALKPEDCRKHE